MHSATSAEAGKMKGSHTVARDLQVNAISELWDDLVGDISNGGSEHNRGCVLLGADTGHPWERDEKSHSRPVSTLRLTS